jgi:hypothetical protein
MDLGKLGMPGWVVDWHVDDVRWCHAIHGARSLSLSGVE